MEKQAHKKIKATPPVSKKLTRKRAFPVSLNSKFKNWGQITNASEVSAENNGSPRRKKEN